MSAMPFDDLETAYETLAIAIDPAGEQREALFLTRLALVLGHELGDIAAFEAPSRPRSTGWNSDRSRQCSLTRRSINCPHASGKIFSWDDRLRFFAPHNIIAVI